MSASWLPYLPSSELTFMNLCRTFRRFWHMLSCKICTVVPLVLEILEILELCCSGIQALSLYCLSQCLLTWHLLFYNWYFYVLSSHSSSDRSLINLYIASHCSRKWYKAGPMPSQQTSLCCWNVCIQHLKSFEIFSSCGIVLEKRMRVQAKLVNIFNILLQISAKGIVNHMWSTTDKRSTNHQILDIPHW